MRLREVRMNPGWQYDETRQVGTDYADAEEVEAYDARMQKLRDIRKEIAKIHTSLNITKDQTILEIGCGTGEFTLEAAKHCSKVIAVDVSLPMLEFAKKKAMKQGITN